MVPSTKTTSIFISTACAVALVVSAFVLSSSQGPSRVGAESSEELLRAYAEKDTDGDNLNDWLEVLYGADPHNPHSLDASLTDREAVDAGKAPPKFASEAAPEVDIGATLDVLPGGDATAGSLT
jgi:hypothetical protein